MTGEKGRGPGDALEHGSSAGQSTSAPLPHPVTGDLFTSPVPPGSGWPGDPAQPDTPVAQDAGEVTALAAEASSVQEVDALVSVCRACPRLVAWRQEVAHTKRRQFLGEPYWGRPVASLGDTNPRILIVGLAPAAQGGNRTGRMFTGDRSGDWIMAALHRAGYATQAASWAAGDGLQLDGARILAPVHCAPPGNSPTPAERATCGTWLDRELQLTSMAEAALVLGGIGWQGLHSAAARLGWDVPRPRVKFGHGAQTRFRRPDGSELKVVGSYHVSQQNTFTGRLTEPMLDAVIAQLTAGD